MPVTTTAHSTKSIGEDLKVVVSVAMKKKLLTNEGKRSHTSFPDMSADPLHKWDRNKAIEWIQKKLKEYKIFNRK